MSRTIESNQGRAGQRGAGRAAALAVAWLLSVFAPGAFAQSTSLLANSSFETPALGPSGYSYETSGASWVFTGNAGVTGNSSTYSYGSPNAPDGTQAGFLQGTGTASQTLSLEAGSYSLTLQAVQRVAYQNGTQVLRISVDGTPIGTFQPPSGAYGSSPTYAFTVTAGSHTLQFTGAGSGSDYTAFVVSVPGSHLSRSRRS